MLRVCLDSNVWLSGLAFSGPPAQIVDMAMGRKFQIVTSLFILDEVQRNLVDKLNVHPRKAKALHFRIAQVADLYDPKGTVRIIENHLGDNMVLETAWIGRAKYLVTGDKQHLLPLRIFRHVKIVGPSGVSWNHKEMRRRTFPKSLTWSCGKPELALADPDPDVHREDQ